MKVRFNSSAPQCLELQAETEVDLDVLGEIYLAGMFTSKALSESLQRGGKLLLGLTVPVGRVDTSLRGQASSKLGSALCELIGLALREAQGEASSEEIQLAADTAPANTLGANGWFDDVLASTASVTSSMTAADSQGAAA